MAYNNSHYWRNKEQRAQVAKEHTEYMEQEFHDEIIDCIEESSVYSYCDSPFSNFNNRKKEAEIILIDKDSASAIFDYPSDMNNKSMVLNFASYKNPGGMFIQGSSAQEESLCHESYLYNVLKEFDGSFYAYNRQNKNKALYTNRAIYSEYIRFMRDTDVFCDVLTCAAPNKTAAQKYCNVTDRLNYSTLKERIRFVITVAALNKPDTLILGAYGCGVFGQNPFEVAKIFKDIFDEYPRMFDRIVFAIPNRNSKNYEAFEAVFNK